MAVLMPQAGGREDQVTALHRAFFATHQRPRAFAFHHHAHRVRRVAVHRCQLPWQQQLHAQVHGRTGLHIGQAVARIGQHQHAALCLFDGGQFTGLNEQLTNLGVGPVRGLGFARRDVGRQHAAQAGPQRHQIALGEFVAVGLRQVFQAP